MTPTIRLARLEDVSRLREIYRYYVEETAVTFDYEVPSQEEFAARMQDIQSFYPYLVTEEAGQIVGYAYSAPFHVRPAYAWSAEMTIYLDHRQRHKGLGRLLYQQLEHYLRQMGVLNLNACIASTAVEDAYLTNHSSGFHQALGYQLVGTFHSSGYKFNRWYDMIWMEKMLGEHLELTPPVQSIHTILKQNLS